MDRIKIGEDLLDAFIAGDATPEEAALVMRAMRDDAALREKVRLLRLLEDADEEGAAVPLERAAAAAPGNLCDVMCERRILSDYLPETALVRFLADDVNTWITEKGVPLYDIGEGLRLAGMAVLRRYDCTVKDIGDGLRHGYALIAVADDGLLDGGAESGTLHAVVVLAHEGTTMTVYDPADDADVYVFTDDFLRAWAASRCYLVTAAPGELQYIPHPVDTRDVLLDDDLLALTAALAENAHETAQDALYGAGWRCGDYDATAKTRPDMVPFSRLPEEARAGYGEAAAATLRLARKLGYRIYRPGRYRCPDCGGSVEKDHIFCPTCGRRIGTEDYDAIFFNGN